MPKHTGKSSRRDPAEDRGRIVSRLLATMNGLKILHWETESLAVHLATDRVLERMPKLVDRFVETMQGSHGRIKLGGDATTISLDNGDSPSALKTLLRDFAAWLEKDVPKLLHGRAGSDLLNLRDELLALAHLGLYLASLH